MSRLTATSDVIRAAAVGAALVLAVAACSGGIDDTVPVDGVTCSSCHGNIANAAPPAGVNGEETTDQRAVGAHQSHLADGTIRKSVGCGACHVVPRTITADGHIDALPAEITWGILSRLGDAEPVWDREIDTCSSTYCHGATLSGGTYTAPVWTDVQDGPLACDSCHGSPPPLPHPQVSACGGCHPDTVTESGLIDVEGGRHIDGVVEVLGQGCSGCHGSDVNPAPPVGLSGATETSDVAVGAHQVHLGEGRGIRSPIGCTECHTVPATVDAAGHIDELPADLVWGALATTDGAAPAWDRAARTCSSTYCHGTTLSGGAATEPVWTTVDGTQSTCGSCHGAPPPLPHPQADDCSGCHPGTLNADGTIDVAGGQHIDGTLQVVAGGCSACHGSDANAAPPTALDGATQTSDPGVGAHQTHLTGGTVAGAIACSQCHAVPTDVGDAGHLDGEPVDFVWGDLATADGAEPSYDFTSTSCSSTYCHGATLSGGAVAAPDWTVVDGSQLACSSCHGFPPPAPHPDNADCAACHPGTLTAEGDVDIDGGQHIDGTIQLATSCTACHGSEAGPAPPAALNGATARSDIGVGAHQAHLEDGDFRAALGCGDCHPAVESVAGHIDGVPAELAWGDLATADDAEPAWDRGAATCSSTYCHGGTLAGGSLPAPVWTEDPDLTCASCHGFPPPEPHPQSTACRSCHPLTVTAAGTIDIAGGRHINGELDIPMTSCTACHGGVVGPAPPPALDGSTSTDDLGVGAHEAHIVGGTLTDGVACTECHVFPGSVDAPGHLDAPPADLTWGDLATTGGQLPEWDRDAATCSSTYCHGATLSGGVNKTPEWTDSSDAAKACGACHGFPPPAPHPASSACRMCHPDTVLEDGSIDIEGGQHIDGEIDTPF